MHLRLDTRRPPQARLLWFWELHLTGGGAAEEPTRVCHVCPDQERVQTHASCWWIDPSCRFSRFEEDDPRPDESRHDRSVRVTCESSVCFVIQNTVFILSDHSLSPETKVNVLKSRRRLVLPVLHRDSVFLLPLPGGGRSINIPGRDSVLMRSRLLRLTRVSPEVS